MRVTTPSCSTRSSLACAASDMSPTSSRNSVPPSACSNFPARSAKAPVNDPFMCPNSSLSISSDGIAAQFTSTNAWSRRGEASCSAARDQLLAGAVLAGDQHPGAGGPDLGDQLAHRCSAALAPTIG